MARQSKSNPKEQTSVNPLPRQVERSSSVKEERFYRSLRDIFVGAKVEGESGYINLMRIKSRYYEKGVFPKLKQDIEEALKPFPEFREELFDKLYTFFNRYFSGSGSIYFRYTPLHQNVYEKVYTDDKDVMLFWKTHMLYYVKTDRLFKNLEVEIPPVSPLSPRSIHPAYTGGKEGGIKFFFDVSTLEHKKANEKRDLIYEFKEKRKDSALVFTVAYSEKGRKTKVEDILKELKKQGVKVSEEILERAFRVFERQSEVDYFINKDAKAFLEEQFNLWMYQYMFSGVSEWTETRIKQLQTLKDVAFKIIAFISQFEDELVKIWNKPKFVLNLNYVITLDRIATSVIASEAKQSLRRSKSHSDPERSEGEESLTLVKKILNHPNFKLQVEEWQQLGIVDKSFKKTDMLERNGKGKRLAKPYKYLPIDTKHFKDVEMEILGLFEDLDAELDGWLIKSENYQALNTMLPKFRERVQCIHVDPPYNTDTSGFLYANKFRHSSWLTMMENRLRLAVDLLLLEGYFLCHADENEYERLKLAFDEMGISDAGTIVWDKRNPMTARAGVALQHEYVIWRTNANKPIYMQNGNIRAMLAKAKEVMQKHGGPTPQATKEYADWVRTNPALSGGEKAYCLLDGQGRVYQSVSLRAPEPRADPKFFQPLIHPVTGKPCPVPPNGFSRTPETLQEMLARGEIIFGGYETIQPRQKRFLTEESEMQVRSVIQDASKGKAYLDDLGLNFPYCHPVSLYKALVGAATSDQKAIILDFFAGSGTTAHAVINLNREDGGSRKYILVEMADYFDSVMLPRIKKVVFSDKWKDGKAQDGGTGISHFCRYYHLEQYEDALRQAKYGDADLFNDPNKDPYHQYVFLRDLKMLEALEVDTKKNEVKVDLGKLYDGIDIAETLSNLKGKWIKRITPDSVEFEDGEKSDIKNLDWKLIKPLIWW
ncbi:MAG: site-specific DNA-methyltransferase [Thermodesulfobacteriota bacterium]